MQTETYSLVEWVGRNPAIVIAGFSLAISGVSLGINIRKHILEWGAELTLEIPQTSTPPVQLRVVNLNKFAVDLRYLRVRDFSSKDTVRTFQLRRVVGGERDETIPIQNELNEYVWKIPPRPGDSISKDWHETRTALELCLGFSTRAKARETDWAPVTAIIRSHSQFGRRVDGAEPIQPRP